MADVNNPGEDRTLPDVAWTDADPAMAPRTVTDADHLLPARTHAAPVGTIGALDDPDLARAQIEATRARMSGTIEEIEARLAAKKQELLQKKEELTGRLDVMRPVREKVRDNSWAALGGVFAAGLLLGYLTGGGDEDEARPAVREFSGYEHRPGHEEWQERARTWENRARRLMNVASEQEVELERLRGGPRSERYTLLDRVRPSRRRERRLRDALSDGLAEGLADVVELEVTTTTTTRGGYDGMPLHDADSQPPRDEELRGGPYQRDPIPSPT
ncbi:MAG TPA: hypothetical protein VFQ45_10040 [Longimicrobium sp.]|nr:hypothetical protein [Longimicrobium sp.]